MNNIIKTIQGQVLSCKKLLTVFQKERQLYNVKKAVGIKEVKTVLARKKLIVSAFEAQHSVLKELKVSQGQVPETEEKAQKDSLRELGALLEQLLVIDHENEKLLRKLLSVKPSVKAVNPRSLASGAVARPALQRQLPFIPGGGAPSAVSARPVVSTQAPVSKLRQYGSLQPRQQSASKYA